LKGETTFHYVAVSWGYCQVNPYGVNVLAETAERPEEIDLSRANQSQKEAEQRIMTTTMTGTELEENQGKIARARARREVATHTNGTTH
jgi:F-type H+-transporting ATPase subunit epsilon